MIFPKDNRVVVSTGSSKPKYQLLVKGINQKKYILYWNYFVGARMVLIKRVSKPVMGPILGLPLNFGCRDSGVSYLQSC